VLHLSEPYLNNTQKFSSDLQESTIDLCLKISPLTTFVSKIKRHPLMHFLGKTPSSQTLKWVVHIVTTQL